VTVAGGRRKKSKKPFEEGQKHEIGAAGGYSKRRRKFHGGARFV
jgi:hypothetical protein